MLVRLAKTNKYLQECAEIGIQSLLVDVQMGATTLGSNLTTLCKVKYPHVL